MSLEHGPTPAGTINGETGERVLPPTVHTPSKEELIARLIRARIYRPNSPRAEFYADFLGRIADRDMSAVRIDGAWQNAWAVFYARYIDLDTNRLVKVGAGINKDFPKTIRRVAAPNREIAREVVEKRNYRRSTAYRRTHRPSSPR